MFIFKRPLAAPLLAIATAAIFVLLSTLGDLSAMF